MDLKSEHNSSKKQDEVIEVLNRFFPENTNHLRERFSISGGGPPSSFPGIGGCDSQETSRTIARRIAAVLIELQQLKQEHPHFFREIDPNDPDLDMNVGFKTYEQLKRRTNNGR